jgi:cytochrome d ubiquinol oxidase subunit I
MGQWGEAFGVPFAIEGLFFFAEAIFIAIYIYGWRRLKPWPHFWTGVPIVITGIGGTVSVVAANAWMNHPGGFTLNSAGDITDVDPWKVVFNKAMPYEASHMLVAAYLVGGFLVASVYAAGMLRGRRDRYHRLGFIIPFTVAAIATPVQMVVGDTLARWVYENEPIKFAAIELVPKTDSDVPETLLGHMNSDGEVTGGIPIPGLASILSDPADGTSTVVQGRNAFPEDDQPTIAQANTVHLAWDVMIGIVSIVAMEAGWVVTEVGRQPWIVFGHMRVEDAATTNTGVWLTFVVILVLYLAVAATTIAVLRRMSRRFRQTDATAEVPGPYSPRDRTGLDRETEEVAP